MQSFTRKCDTKLNKFIFCLCVSHFAQAAQLDIIGPPGSGEFGKSVTLLPNGNLVITDPSFDLQNPTVADVGAVYLYAPNGEQISRITGSSPNDAVGNGGVTVLANGNFVALSRTLNGSGAVTWGSATQGVQGAVSVVNSLMISPEAGAIVPLSNGNYLVVDSDWGNASVQFAGAITLCNGSTGTVGVASAANSLVGSHNYDRLGGTTDGVPIVKLTNGNFVVPSPGWNNYTGAVTWGNADGPFTGVVSAANSLVGTSPDDFVGDGGLGQGVIALANGNYVVASPDWDWLGATRIRNVGAVTWGNGRTGTTGVVSPLNSLVGSSGNDAIGTNYSVYVNSLPRTLITPLTNGNYVVVSTGWDAPITGEVDVGAVTWGNGNGGTTGEIKATNSFIGSTQYDQVGLARVVGNSTESVIALPNGHYVFASKFWSQRTGAVTWGNGYTGSSGIISSLNSLIGGQPFDQVGSGPEFGDSGKAIVVLANSNYVVSSPYWSATALSDRVGAATWGNGQIGTRGVVSAVNSLVGDGRLSLVGVDGIVALSNGNYVVNSSAWSSSQPELQGLGAATWGNGQTGTTGVVSAGNSLVGSRPGDSVGRQTIALKNGNYVVGSPAWKASASVPAAGAATWGDGARGSAGVVDASNSLVGSHAEDRVGDSLLALENSNYVVASTDWDSGALTDAGAVTWGNGATGLSGEVSEANSLLGSHAGDRVGQRIFPLSQGAYVVSSPKWDGAAPDVGAVSWSAGTSALVGPISLTNSLVGSPERPVLAAKPLSQGTYAAYSIDAVSFGGTSGVQGMVNANNSVLGAVLTLPISETMPHSRTYYDHARRQLIVGTPQRNIVSILPEEIGTLFRGDFE